ncbi:MAG: GntR family transcriptional regulator [Rhodoferax sp.]|nr:GntR family transcriptional regulator [Rhodoferax sp.]
MAVVGTILPASTVDTACDAIRQAIQSGRFVGGDRIREVEICALAKVSRTSVRQALTLLAGEGYVELRPNRGAVVVDWTADKLLEIFDLRALLEAYAASLAATRGSDQEKRQMRLEAERFQALIRISGELDLREIAESNNRLHRMILDASRNPRLASVLVAVVHVPLVRQTFSKYNHEALERSAMQHLDLVSALEAGDPVWAEAAMRSHILAAKKVIFGANALPALATPALRASA